MFLIGNFVSGVAAVLDLGLQIYMWIVIIGALISWVNPDPYNPIVRFLRGATEPVFYRIRRTVPAIAAGIDFSPVIVILVILFLRVFLVGSLFDIAARMR